MIRSRPVDADDVEFLWQMLYLAAHVDEDDGVGHDDMRRDPDLLGHVAGWGREGDIGLLAEIGGVPVGAAWVRLFDPDTSDHSVYVDPQTPELVIAVASGSVGTGIGSTLMARLFELTDDVFPAVVLSVRSGNPAQRLYERFDFYEIGRIVNRVGAESLQMLRKSPGHGRAV